MFWQIREQEHLVDPINVTQKVRFTTYFDDSWAEAHVMPLMQHLQGQEWTMKHKSFIQIGFIHTFAYLMNFVKFLREKETRQLSSLTTQRNAIPSRSYSDCHRPQEPQSMKWTPQTQHKYTRQKALSSIYCTHVRQMPLVSVNNRCCKEKCEIQPLKPGDHMQISASTTGTSPRLFFIRGDTDANTLDCSISVYTSTWGFICLVSSKKATVTAGIFILQNS